MKAKIAITVLAAALAASAALTMQAFMKADDKKTVDGNGHVLTALWKKYYAAEKADLPLKEVEALEAIKEEAKARRYHWDFYDAAIKKVEAGTARDWKKRQELRGELLDEVEEYSEPIVTFACRTRFGTRPGADFVITNKARLQAARNEMFYSSTTGEMDSLLNSFMKDDYEYALWAVLLGGQDKEKAAAALKEVLGDTYPNAAWLEYALLRDASSDSRKDGLEKFVEKYAGKAVNLFAKAELFRVRMQEMRTKDVGEDAWKAIYSEIKAAEKERRSYTSGTDAKIAFRIQDFRNQMEELERKEISIGFKDGKIQVMLRNLDKVEVSIALDVKGASPLLKRTLINPGKRFYVIDTVEVPVPRCDDGDYVVKAISGKVSEEAHYAPKTLSIALREEAGGRKFYVADYMSGEPASKVDLQLSLSGESVAEVKDVAVDGFTPLPEAITKAISKNAYYVLEASYRGDDGYLRKSGTQGIYKDVAPRIPETVDAVHCNIFTDKGAYNPGETLKFKAVLYVGDLRRSIRVMDAGGKVTARLFNAEGKELESLELRTNEYGSVAGSFVLPEGERNGRFRIEIAQDRSIASRSVVVDEFILPTYDLAFDSADKLYFVGDEVVVKGRLSSYSGHPLDAAEVTYTVDSWGNRIDSGTVTVGADGSFSISFMTVDNRYAYDVTVKVKDATGETKEFSRRVYVLDYLDIGLDLGNASVGSVRLGADDWGGCSLLSGGIARVKFTVRNNEGQTVPVPVSYELKDSERKVASYGTAMSGETVEIGITAPGRYSLTASSKVRSDKCKEISQKQEMTILRLDDDAKVLPAPVENVFKLVGPCADGTLKAGEAVEVQFGAGAGPVWAIAELFGDRRQPLGRTMARLDGKAGESGSLTTLSYEYKDEYPDDIYLTIFYFRHGKHFTFSRAFHREKTELELPLSFSSFEDKAMPGKEYSLTLKSAPGVEAVAAVFDKASETISPNRWQTVRLVSSGAQPVSFQVTCGGVGFFDEQIVVGYGVPRSGIRFKSTRSTGAVMAANSVDMAAPEMMMLEESVQAEDAMSMAADEDGGIEDIPIRSDFSSSLAFEPFLRSDSEGNLGFSFRTSDKLSTFVVQVYAHTQDMKNALVREEVTVSLPVRVSVVEPLYLFKGDKYVLRATVSSVSDTPVSGTVALQAYPSADRQASKPFLSASKKVTIPAGGSVPVEFEVDPKSHDELGLKVAFSDAGKTFSDGVFVSLPVHEAAQTLTEAHSAVLLAGMDKDALLKRLQGEFTGTTSKGAEYKEVDIRQMLLEAIPSKVEPSGKDVLSLSEAFYVRHLASALHVILSVAKDLDEAKDLWPRILACRNADGGFGWFEGMKSSPVITAVLLERFAKMRDAGLLTESFDPAPSVKYLDRSQFVHPASWPRWCGWLSMEQYAYVRSMYSSVPFDVSTMTASEESGYSKNFKEFKKEVKDYLVPSAKDGRGLEGRILDKARRIRTLVNLVYGDGGTELAAKWGIRFSAESKMKASIAADVASLNEYAVEHRDGGWYYPNAVMPWRGLLESELYAHSLLCDLLSDTRVSSSPAILSEAKDLSIQDGIRIWIMLQKETQQWASDPAYVDAINSVFSGSEEVLSTKVMTMTKTYRKPFSEIVAAGNGFTIERHFYKEVAGEGGKVGKLEIFPGMKLSVGDKVTAEYKVWNQENRSFVCLTAPREAAFRPVDQLSGHYGWWLRPLSYSVTPQGYRNVKADRTEYYFDVYPEEYTTVTEEFFITQEGTFTAPVVTIESLYAPHYRANDKFGGTLKVD